MALLPLLLSGVEAFALPEASCQQTLQDFQKIKNELQQAKTKNICSVVLGASISKYEKTNSCAEVYLVADRTVASYEAQRKSGCSNLQQMVTNAKSCNPSGANQAKCFLAAAEAYEFASNFEKQMSGGIQQNLNKLGLVETAGQKALEKYQSDLKESASAISLEKRRRSTAPDPASVEMGIKNATAVKNHVLRSGVSGEVNASEGGKKTIVEYHDALRAEGGHISAHSEALRFANDFRLEAEKLKKGMQQRISSFDQAAKDSRSRAQGSSTATDDQTPPPSQAAGGSGISLPSLPSSAGGDSSAQSGGNSEYPQDNSKDSAESKRAANSTFDKTDKKETVKPKVDAKNFNRESISYQKSSTVNIPSAAERVEKKKSRFEFGGKKIGGRSEENFQSKGSALIGALRENEAKENAEVAAKNFESHELAEGGGDLDDKKAEQPAQPDDLPQAEEEAIASAEGLGNTEDDRRDLASLDDPSGVQEDFGFDLSTSLFDRVNRKLFQAYKTGRVIYDR